MMAFPNFVNEHLMLCYWNILFQNCIMSNWLRVVLVPLCTHPALSFFPALPPARPLHINSHSSKCARAQWGGREKLGVGGRLMLWQWLLFEVRLGVYKRWFWYSSLCRCLILLIAMHIFFPLNIVEVRRLKNTILPRCHPYRIQ